MYDSNFDDVFHLSMIYHQRTQIRTAVSWFNLDPASNMGVVKL